MENFTVLNYQFAEEIAQALKEDLCDAAIETSM